MRARRLDFARRPFHDERPVILVVGLAFLVAGLLFVANVRLYRNFNRDIQGTGLQIDFLQKRRDKASREADAARVALSNFKVSALAVESGGLIRIVHERRFSWTGLFARLERALPPEVRVTRLTPHFEESGDTTLDIALLGKDADSVVRTIAAFSKDPVFASMVLHSESSPERGVPEGRTFVMTVVYRPGAKP